MGKVTKSEATNVALTVPPLFESVIEYVFRSEPVKEAPCRICSTPGATARSDGLCWVCRRLKVSAWQGAGSADGSGE